VPLVVLNCIVVFSMSTVNKMVPLTVDPTATSRATDRSPSACAGEAARSGRDPSPHCGACVPQVLGSLLFSCIMVGKKMLVVAVIIRLRTRREELASVLQHLRAAVAPRELTPIQTAADSAEAAFSWA
jgi:hypothetical protein